MNSEYCFIYLDVNMQKYQHKLTAARLKKGAAQWFRVANLARIFINLSWYYCI